MNTTFGKMQELLHSHVLLFLFLSLTHPAASLWTTLLLGQPGKVILPFPNMPAYPCTIEQSVCGLEWIRQEILSNHRMEKTNGKTVFTEHQLSIMVFLLACSLSLSLSHRCSIMFLCCCFISPSLYYSLSVDIAWSMLCYFANDNLTDWCNRSCCKRRLPCITA